MRTAGKIGWMAVAMAVALVGTLAGQDKPTLDELLAQKAEGAPPYTLTEWEQEFLRDRSESYSAPAPHFLEAEDGLQLAYREWVPDNWKGAGAIYLIVPGSTSHSVHFAFLGSSLRERGILTRVIDFRGTGLSVCRSKNRCGDPATFTPRVASDDGEYFSGRVGDVADADQIARDLKRHLADLRSTWPQARLLVSGHSSGGGLICRMVESIGKDPTRSDDPQRRLSGIVDGVVLLAPYVHWTYAANTETNDRYSVVHGPTLQKVLGGAQHLYTLGFNVGDRIETDPWVVWKWTQEMASAMAAYGRDSFWPYFTVPTAYVIGTREELFDLEVARREHAKAASPGPFVVLEDATHLGMRWRPELVEFMVDFAQSPSAVR